MSDKIDPDIPLTAYEIVFPRGAGSMPMAGMVDLYMKIYQKHGKIPKAAEGITIRLKDDNNGK